MWSNTLTITAYIPFEIRSHRISGPSRVEVGKTFTISGQVEFTTGAPSTLDLYVNVEVNGSIVERNLRVATVRRGARSASYSFTLRFTRPGTYRVRAYAFTAPHGVRPW